MATLQEVLARRKRAKTFSAPAPLEAITAYRQHLLDLADEMQTLRGKVTEAIMYAKAIKPEKGEPGRDAPKLDEKMVAQELAKRIPKPRDGKDADEAAITKRVIARIPKPRDGIDGKDAVVDHEKIASRVLEVLKEQKLKPEHVEGIGEMMQKYWQKVQKQSKSGVMRGGGDTVLAGTGITITRDSVGRSTIAASGTAAGTPVYSEVVSGANNSWTLAHTPLAGTLRLYAEGQRLIAGGVDYTLSGTAITTTNSYPASSLISDYNY